MKKAAPLRANVQINTNNNDQTQPNTTSRESQGVTNQQYQQNNQNSSLQTQQSSSTASKYKLKKLAPIQKNIQALKINPIRPPSAKSILKKDTVQQQLPMRSFTILTQKNDIVHQLNIQYNKQNYIINNPDQTLSLYQLLCDFEQKYKIQINDKRIVIKNTNYQSENLKLKTMVQLQFNAQTIVYLFDQLTINTDLIKKQQIEQSLNKLDGQISNRMWRICKCKLMLNDKYTVGQGVRYMKIEDQHTLVNLENLEENSDYEIIQ